MLLFMTPQTLNALSMTEDVRNLVVFNYSSLLEGLPTLNYLLPPFALSTCNNDEYQFDINYANYIINNEQAFSQMFTIVYNLYQGNDVCILIMNDDDFVSESLQKFLQERYGILAYRVGEPEDYPQFDQTSFSINGLYNLDQDKERYTVLYLKNNPELVDNEVKKGDLS